MRSLFAILGALLIGVPRSSINRYRCAIQRSRASKFAAEFVEDSDAVDESSSLEEEEDNEDSEEADIEDKEEVRSLFLMHFGFLATDEGQLLLLFHVFGRFFNVDNDENADEEESEDVSPSSSLELSQIELVGRFRCFAGCLVALNVAVLPPEGTSFLTASCFLSSDVCISKSSKITQKPKNPSVKHRV